MKFTSAHRLSAPLAALALLVGPTHLLAQTAAEPAAAQADINSMPKWSEFPVPPTEITTPAEFQAAVTDTLAKRQQLKTETDALVWDDTVPETFAADARDRIDPAHTAPIEAQTTTPAQINALAEDLRKRAAPPPVIK